MSDLKLKKLYPTYCTAAYCEKGGDTCTSKCPWFAELKGFEQWVKETGAIKEDPIWCPSVYTAQK